LLNWPSALEAGNRQAGVSSMLVVSEKAET